MATLTKTTTVDVVPKALGRTKACTTGVLKRSTPTKTARVNTLAAVHRAGISIVGGTPSQQVTLLTTDGVLQRFTLTNAGMYNISLFNYSGSDVNVEVNTTIHGSHHHKAALAHSGDATGASIMRISLPAGPYVVDLKTFRVAGSTVPHYLFDIKQSTPNRR